MPKPISVLLIEDNPMHIHLLRTFLQQAEGLCCSVSVANDLASGIAQARQRAFDVLLLDLILPDSQELLTLERVQAAIPDVPTIVLTGLDDEDWAQRAIAAGAHSYLVKTEVNAERLSLAVCAAVDAAVDGGQIGAR